MRDCKLDGRKNFSIYSGHFHEFNLYLLLSLVNILGLLHCQRKHYICLCCGFILNSGDRTLSYTVLSFLCISLFILVTSGLQIRMRFCLWYVCLCPIK
jgi:hypothetical protein